MTVPAITSAGPAPEPTAGPALPDAVFAGLLAALTTAAPVPVQVPAPAAAEPSGAEPSGVVATGAPATGLPALPLLPTGAAAAPPLVAGPPATAGAPAVVTPSTVTGPPTGVAAPVTPSPGAPPAEAAPEPARGRSPEHADVHGLAHRRTEPGRPVERATSQPGPDQPAPAAPVVADTAPQPQPAAVPATAPAPPVVPAAPVVEAVRSTRAEGPTHRVLPAVVDAARHLRAEGGRTSLVVRLDPPELGAVVVRLTVQDGRVDVHLRTPDLAAGSDLQAQSWDVQQVLREHGLDLASFDVSQASGGSAGDLPGGALAERENRPSPDRATAHRGPAADGAENVTDDDAHPRPAGTWL